MFNFRGKINLLMHSIQDWQIFILSLTHQIFEQTPEPGTVLNAEDAKMHEKQALT